MIPPPVPPAQIQKAEPCVVVTASWYGCVFAGRKTSSGEVFDPKRLTCAHREFPFGTRLLVTCLITLRAVVVIVTDRGPMEWTKREIDLSEAAAEAIGIHKLGVAPVVINVLK